MSLAQLCKALHQAWSEAKGHKRGRDVKPSSIMQSNALALPQLIEPFMVT